MQNNCWQHDKKRRLVLPSLPAKGTPFLDCCVPPSGGRETPENGPANLRGSQIFCRVAGDAHFEVHKANQSTTSLKPTQHLPHKAIYSGATVPIHARCVNILPTQNAFHAPSHSLTLALSRPSRHTQATHTHHSFPIRRSMYTLSTECNIW